jgi:DTW domain-containing protein YfiP
MWDRVTPDPELLANIERESVALLYPTQDSESLASNMHFDSIIILDGTWQQAQKMVNRSPYLKALTKIKITPEQPSIYTLRRNQKKMAYALPNALLKY